MSLYVPPDAAQLAQAPDKLDALEMMLKSLREWRLQCPERAEIPCIPESFNVALRILFPKGIG